MLGGFTFMRKLTKLSVIAAVLLLLSLSLTGCEFPPIVSSCSHQWSDATCTDPVTCVLCGETNGGPLGHYWIDATCTSAEMCKRCGERKGSPLGHEWMAATCTEPETCARCYGTKGKPTGHKWVDADCTHAKYCDLCGIKGGDIGDHDWVDATCSEEGYCRICLTPGDPINPDAHTIEDGKCIHCDYVVYPTITVSSATYSKSSGEENITVVVSISQNPGVLGMTLVLEYNTDAMDLISTESGEAFSTLDFSNSGNAVNWDGEKISESDIKDGEILVLTFRMNSYVSCGDYNVNVKMIHACDNDFKPLDFKINNGTVTVTE